MSCFNFNDNTGYYTYSRVPRETIIPSNVTIILFSFLIHLVKLIISLTYSLLSGKMFGIHASYIIAEVEFYEGEDPDEPAENEQQQQEQEGVLINHLTLRLKP